jgi:hypothetical protein
MRIRTANGVGFVRLSALVIVLVVMSGSAFGQDKQSGRAIKSNTSKNTGVQQRSGIGKTNSKKDAGVTPLPVRKELEATIQTDPVYVEADRVDNPKPHEARQPPSLIDFGGDGSGGGHGFPGGGSGSSDPPVEPPDENGGCYCVWEQNKVDKLGGEVPGCGPIAQYILHELRFRCTFKSGGNPCQNFTSQWDCQHTKKITDMTCLPPPPNAPVTIITTSDCIKCHTND